MKKGTISMSIGLLFVLAALFLTIYNINEEKRAGESATVAALELQKVVEMEAKESETKEDYLKYPEMEMPVAEVEGIRYVGILEVPILNLRLPIIHEWSEANARTAPCRYGGTAYKGNFVIAGHNYRTHFANLKNLNVGDEVSFTDMAGNCFAYQVAEIEILDGTAVEEMQTDEWDMTLFTCTYSGRTRLTVRCDRLE